MKASRDAAGASRARRSILIACLVICAAGAALNLTYMATGHGGRWTIVFFCVALSGLLSSISSLVSMGGRK